MMPARIFSSVLLVVFLCVVVFIKGTLGEIVFVAGATLMVFLLSREMSEMAKNLGLGDPGIRISVYAVAYFLLVALARFVAKNEIVFFAAINLAFAILLWTEMLMFSGDSARLRTSFAAASILFLVVMPLSCLLMIYMFRFGNVDGRMAFLYLVAVTKAGDIGGYLGGMASSAIMKGGNHKIFPKISPKKSWEGTFCGLVFSVAASVLVSRHTGFFGGGFEAAVTMGMTFFIGGFLGDLAESSLKRAAGVKDSGKVIPGIGGIFDLVDSFILTGPILYLLLMLKAII